jgi:hypothetical protein
MNIVIFAAISLNKMLKHITLATLFMLLAHCCPAQKTIIFNLPADSTIADNNVCHSLRVIDMRKHKDSIGGLSITTSKVETKVVPEQPLDIMLNRYFDEISANKKGEFELLLVLHDFQITKLNRNIDLGYFHFSGDFYIGKDGKYHMLDSVDHIYEFGPTKKFIEGLIAYTQQNTFQLINKYAPKAVSMKWLKLTEQDAQNRRANIKAKYPIYTGEFKQGIYFTVDQFLANSPSDTEIIVKEIPQQDGKKIYYYHYKNAKGKAGKQIDGDSYFAIYDGKSWHLGGESGIRKMKFHDGEFTAVRVEYGLRAEPKNNFLYVPVGGGAIGPSIAANGAAIGISYIINSSKNRDELGEVYYNCRFDPAQKKFIPFKRLE